MPQDRQLFCQLAVELVQDQSHGVTVQKTRSSGPKPHPDHAVAQDTLAKSVVRLAVLNYIASRNWLTLGNRHDYPFALYEAWKKDPKGYLFQQLLAQVFTVALCRRSYQSRPVVAKRLGTGPNLGRPLVQEEEFTADYSWQGAPVFIPGDFWEGLLGKDGVFRQVNRKDNPLHDHTYLSDCLAHFYHEIRKTPNADLYENSAIARVKGDILHKEEATRGLDPLERIRRFMAIKVVDPSCGPGSVLIHMVRESMVKLELLCQEADVPFERPASVRAVVERGLHGMDSDPFAVEVARLRLALEVIANDPEPAPLPDISRDVELGDGVIVVSMFTAPQEMPPEGPQVEFKSTLEWDSRRQQRSPALLHGVLKTIVAYLNTEGGVLYIGVGDDGNPKGLVDDFALIKDPAKEDVFENRLREIIKNHIDPIPLAAVNISFPEIAGIKVCQLVVRPLPDVATYLLFRDPKTGQNTEEIFVRDGNRTIALRNRARDQFILARGKSSL